MDKCDLLSGYAARNQLITDIVIRAKTVLALSLSAGRGKVAEDELRPLIRCGALLYVIYIFNDPVQLAFRYVRQCGIGKPLIQRQLAPVIGDGQHIILVWRY